MFPISLTKTAMLTVCAICWALQSYPAIFLYLEGAEIVKRKSVPTEQLVLPQLLFCNKFPFTQAGLSSLGAQFNRDVVLGYLRQWLDPSLGAGPPPDSLGTQLAQADRQSAEATIAQLLPNGRLKQRLEQLMPQCQDMVASCVLQARQLSGFECCRMVQPWLATPRAGLCWPFIGNISSIQSPLDYPRGMQITFQISRNSFLSGAFSVHPGIDVYLIPAEMRNRIWMATNLGESDAHSLDDKRALRLHIRREICNLPPSAQCGPESVTEVQREQLVPGASAGVLCLLEKAIGHCSCVPMIVVLWTLQGDLDSSFLRRFNASTIVGEFEHCVHPYVEFAQPPAWTLYPVPREAAPELASAVETCRKGSPTQCRTISFPAESRERDLPAEYRNTQDFVSRVSVSFDSFVVEERSVTKEMDLYRLLSTLGYNLWWFAIGHLLWTLCQFRCGTANSLKGTVGTNKVEPKNAMIPMAANSVAVSPRQQLPPPHPRDATGSRARQLPPLAINNSGNGTLGGGSSHSEDRHSTPEEEAQRQR